MPRVDLERVFLDTERKQETVETLSYLVVALLVILGACCCFLGAGPIAEATKKAVTEEAVKVGSAIVTGCSTPLLGQVYKHVRRRRQLDYLSEVFAMNCESTDPRPRKCREVRDYVKKLAMPDKV